MKQIIETLKPKEVIAYFNKKYLTAFLGSKGFQFKDNSLEYHRKTADFKQVIWHRCSKNNMTGHIIDFEIGYYNLCAKFKNWYKKQYWKETLGGYAVIGSKRITCQDQWNVKYNKYVGIFGYDLINKDIEDQFAVILENLENVVLPYFDFYKDFEAVIDNPRETIETGEFDLASHLRQIEHCLFIGEFEKSKRLADALRNNIAMPESYHSYRDAELIRIFKTK
jgi:hypothetical protein